MRTIGHSFEKGVSFLKKEAARDEILKLHFCLEYNGTYLKCKRNLSMAFF